MIIIVGEHVNAKFDYCVPKLSTRLISAEVVTFKTKFSSCRSTLYFLFSSRPTTRTNQHIHTKRYWSRQRRLASLTLMPFWFVFLA